MIIQENIDLLPYNTFHFSCRARFFVVIKSIEEIEVLIQSDIWKNTAQKLILGGGSNMCFMNDTFDGIVIKNEIIGKKVIEETETHVLVEVGSGENRDSFVRGTIEHGRGGVENLVSIPGTVGAAPVQNIGAYGVEAKQTINAVHCIDLKEGTAHIFDNAGCTFGYRDSIFKSSEYSQFFISAVRFRLEKINNKYTYNVNYEGVEDKTKQLQNNHPTQSKLRCVATAIATIRATKLPDRKTIGTAGSFFQNPIVEEKQFEALKMSYPEIKGRTTTHGIKLSAGQLIELAGLKGYTKNNVGVYEHHALVLVNHGNTQGSALQEIMKHIIEKTKRLFDVTLVPEVRCFPSGKHLHHQIEK